MVVRDVDVIRILLAEDNRGDAILIREALRDSADVAYEVELVSTLAEALERVTSQRFDAVLLDLGLPDSHGLDTLNAMLASSRAPVLVLTGLDDESTGLQAVQQGAQDYLLKGRTGEEVLRRSLRYAIERARLHAATSSPLIETAPVGLAVFDRGLRYLYANPAMAEINGLPPLSHLGKRIESVTPELGDDVFKLLEEAVASGQAVRRVEIQGRTRAHPEAATWLLSAEPLRDASGVTIGLAASMVDISERKRKEEALAQLAESRLQAQAIGESLAYGIWIADPDGGLRYASESFLQLIGMDMEEASGFGWTRVMPEGTARAMLEAWNACRARSDQWEYEVVVRGVDGHLRTLLSRGHPVFDRAGRITSWAGINLDITERKAGETFREAFLGVLSHELRTPVTSIIGATALLLKDNVGGPRRDELVGDINEEAERLRGLVEDLLVLAKAERGALALETEPVSLARVVTAGVARARRHWEDRSFDLSIAASIPVACGDEPMISRILDNLLSNAVKFGAPGDRIEILLDAMEGRPRMRVLDQGPGVAPEEVERLFEPFYRSARTSRVSGSGIGLFVVRCLVEAMGGTISARRRDAGAGSEFEVILRPFADEAG